MLSWMLHKDVGSTPQQAAPVMKKPAGSVEDGDWYSPNDTLASIEVKELSLAEFLAIYKPSLPQL